MEYYKLVAVTGLPGLYELISSKKDGAIVRSLQDKTTRFASTRVHQFSHLESIEIYTTRDNVNLVDVFQAMEKDSTELPDAKDDKAVKAYFQKVFPEMDFDRVYNSDMKKIVKWFDILKKNEVEIKLSDTPEQEEETAAPEAEEVATAPVEDAADVQKPAKKTVSKKTAAAEENGDEGAKTAAPKKAAAKKRAPAKKKAE